MFRPVTGHRQVSY